MVAWLKQEGVSHPDREIGVRIETLRTGSHHVPEMRHPDREIGVRIETRFARELHGNPPSHPDREIGVRIETFGGAFVRVLLRVTPIVRSGCGLKLFSTNDATRCDESPRS